ncbi:HEPN domain-containing protein [Burkholderia gladioli]|uniref:HEPN domain-containing protein n=1 Tax=Burkholderia gladioli TaxID=28095 RepID=UPI001640707A|nr:HEPN domain-containing protein [Burkholderia gladioli]
MPSQALIKFTGLMGNAKHLVDQAAKLKKKSDTAAKSIFLHAALAAYTAAWDAYIKALAEDYYTSTTNATDTSYNHLHLIAKARMNAAKSKLNTPNSENCRTFLSDYTGFDPWPNWANAGRFAGRPGSSLHAQTRLNEIFKVRHSFAHGFTMPIYSWNQDSSGAAKLNCKGLREIENFFTSLTKETDKGMSGHVATQHGKPPPW